MDRYRRHCLRLAVGALALAALRRPATAQAYPARPVRVIVPFAAGGGADILARLIAQSLSERLSVAVIVENRPGAASNTGTEAVVRAPPDGYTLLLATSVNAVNASLYDRLGFNFIRDIAAVASLNRVPAVAVVNASFPAMTIPQLIARAKASPGKIAMATAGNGSNGHLYGEMFKQLAGVDMVAVPYRGEAVALTDLIGGQVQVMFPTLSSAIEYIRAGQLRPLAVATPSRLAVLPEVPAMSEFLPGYQGSGWQGIGAPARTPNEIIDKLNSEINRILDDPGIAARLADLGTAVFKNSPAAFARIIAEDTRKWANVIRAANIRAE